MSDLNRANAGSAKHHLPVDKQEKKEANAQMDAARVESLVCLERGEAVADSRAVAAKFGKRHDNVLRDIDALLQSSKLRGPEKQWFKEIAVDHPAVKGKKIRAFELTRGAFSLLAFGFTGDDALEWKIKYIKAFDAMEAKLAKANTARCEPHPFKSNGHYAAHRSFDELLAERGLTPDHLLKLLFGSDVPVTGDPDYPLFAAEACAALGLPKPEFEIALARLPDKEKTILTIVTEEGPREHEVITELALYLLAFTPAVALPHGHARSISNLAKYGDVLDALSLAHQIKIIETAWIAFQAHFLDLFPKCAPMLHKADRLVEQAAREADDVLYRHG